MSSRHCSRRLLILAAMTMAAACRSEPAAVNANDPRVVGGAAAGAATGLAIGAIAGDPGKGAAIGAVAGSVGGLLGSACLEARGYSVR